MGEKMGITVEIPQIPIAQKGKVAIHEKRWILERTGTPSLLLGL
jgi:hypothetical protein